MPGGSRTAASNVLSRGSNTFSQSDSLGNRRSMRTETPCPSIVIEDGAARQGPGAASPSAEIGAQRDVTAAADDIEGQLLEPGELGVEVGSVVERTDRRAVDR